MYCLLVWLSLARYGTLDLSFKQCSNVQCSTTNYHLRIHLITQASYSCTLLFCLSKKDTIPNRIDVYIQELESIKNKQFGILNKIEKILIKGRSYKPRFDKPKDDCHKNQGILDKIIGCRKNPSRDNLVVIFGKKCYNPLCIQMVYKYKLSCRSCDCKLLVKEAIIRSMIKNIQEGLESSMEGGPKLFFCQASINQSRLFWALYNRPSSLRFPFEPYSVGLCTVGFL